jgi:thioesterase domain-containing protein
MAQQLTRSGEEVAIVAVLDSGLPNNRGHVGGPRAWVEFSRNLFWWVIDDFMQAGRGEMALRFRSKATLLARRLAAVPGLRWLPHREPDTRDLLGMPSFPREWESFLKEHFASLRAYVPRPYPGRVALLRARTLPVSRLHEADMGWGRMAQGGVEITIVPGSHETILREPHVRLLADALRRTFDEVERRFANLPHVA